MENSQNGILLIVVTNWKGTRYYYTGCEVFLNY